jgi:nitric oxide reductase large subunit
MAFIKVDKDSNLVLNKPLQTFLFIAIAVGLGMMLFTLLLYGLIQAVTSSGFSELKATDDGDRERIDDNDDLEDA